MVGKLIFRRGYKRNNLYIGGYGGGRQRDLDITVALGVRKDDTVTDLDIKVASASFQVCAVCCLLRQETKLPRIVLSTQPSKIVPGNR